MKKIILVFTGVIAFIMFSFNYDTFNYYNYTNIVTYPDVILKGIEHNPIVVNAEQKYYDTILKEFLDYAKESNTAILYSAHPNSDTGYNQYHLYLYAPSITGLEEKLYLEEDKTSIDFSSDDKVSYYTSAIDSGSYNKIRSFDDTYFIKEGTHVYLFPFIQSIGKEFEDNDLFIMVYSNNSEDFMKNIQESLEKKDVLFSWENQKDNYHAGDADSIVDTRNIELIFGLLICFLALIMAYLSLIMKDCKKISIYKMHGYCTIEVIFKLYAKLYIFMMCAYTSVFVVLSYLLTEMHNTIYLILYKQLFIQVIFMLIFVLLLIFISNCYIRKTCNYLALKNKEQLGSMLRLNYIIKLFLGVLLITPFIASYNENIPRFKDFLAVQDKEYEIRNSLYIKRTPSQRDFTYMSKLLDVGTYSDFDTYYLSSYKDSPFVTDIEGNLNYELYMPYPYIVANRNYLSGYEFVDELGVNIDLNDLEDNTLLVPLIYKDLSIIPYTREVTNKIIYVEETGQYTNLVARSNIHTVKNPIIRFVKEWNMNLISFELHLPLKENKGIDWYLQDAYNNGIKKGAIAFGYTFADYDYYVLNAKQSLQKFVSIVLLYMFIFSLFLSQTAYLYVEKNRKLLAIYYISGISKWERYSELTFINLSVYGIIVMLSIFGLKNNVGDTLFFVFTFELYDLILHTIFLKFYEKKNIASVLKGE